MKKSEKPLANVIAFVALLLFASCGFATESSKDIILECTYQSTVILKDGSMSKTAGTKLLTIKRIKDTLLAPIES